MFNHSFHQSKIELFGNIVFGPGNEPTVAGRWSRFMKTSVVGFSDDALAIGTGPNDLRIVGSLARSQFLRMMGRRRNKHIVQSPHMRL
jgi:hypothetical protein